MKKLNNNQILFCQELVNNGLNQTQAYMKAYKTCKSEESARRTASKLLTNVDIQEYIKELQEKLEDKSIMSAKERMKFLTQVIKGEIKENVMILKTDAEGNEEEIEKQFPSKLKTKMEAIDILNKMDGEYTTNIKGELDIVKLEDIL